MATLEDIAFEVTQQEVKLSSLFSDLQKISNNSVDLLQADNSSEINELKLLNSKLHYRIAQLQKSIAEEETKTMQRMTNLKNLITAMFRTALRVSYPEHTISSSIVQHSDSERFGDYKCTVAMPLSQMLKQKGISTSPRDIAQNILQNIPESSSSIIDKYEVAGPGFINVFLKTSFISELISDQLINGIRPPPIDKKLRVVIDFSSPNVAKEMHVGHLRSTIIGETISRLLEFAGHNVLRLNHIGDWGTQFGMLIAHLKDQFPDFATVSPPIGDLQNFYKESKKRFDEDPEFKKRAHSNVVLLQNGDPQVRKGWNLICDVSRQEFQKIYQSLGVSIIERGESFYQPLMPEVVTDLTKKNLLAVEDGRTVMYIPSQSVPLTLVKSDGGYTYDTSDMAALRHRVETEKGDWLIYVVDLGQGLHFKTVFEAGKIAGYVPDHIRIDHVGFGVVLGEDKKKYKTRSGDSVKLRELLEEGLERSLARLTEKGRDKVLSTEELAAAQSSVAYGCVKYADLSHTRTNDYIFSFDKMLDDRGNTAVYLLYAYTRIRSIIRVAGLTGEQMKKAGLDTPIDLSHEKELKLGKCIARFPEVLNDVMSDLYPHTLCDYLYELCTTMTEFYDNCYCIEKNRESGEVISVNMSRILLLEATRQVLSQAFYILGIDPVEKM